MAVAEGEAEAEAFMAVGEAGAASAEAEAFMGAEAASAEAEGVPEWAASGAVLAWAALEPAHPNADSPPRASADSRS